MADWPWLPAPGICRGRDRLSNMTNASDTRPSQLVLGSWHEQPKQGAWVEAMCIRKPLYRAGANARGILWQPPRSFEYNTDHERASCTWCKVHSFRQACCARRELPPTATWVREGRFIIVILLTCIKIVQVQSFSGDTGHLETL